MPTLSTLRVTQPWLRPWVAGAQVRYRTSRRDAEMSLELASGKADQVFRHLVRCDLRRGSDAATP